MKSLGIIRKAIRTEEFDYGSLMHALNSYQKPRDAATRLIHNGSIIPIKKGLYVFGDDFRRELICKESLANLIYGPSYISLEYALSYYGLIPERVEQMTSMTFLRSKTFYTPLGIFDYIHLTKKKFSVGITMIDKDLNHQFLMATPEKALADRIAFHKNLNSSDDVYAFVCEGLRIDEEELAKMNRALLDEIAKVYKNSAVTNLAKLIKDLT